MSLNFHLRGNILEFLSFPGTKIFALLILLELVLKGFALWRAARNGQKWWFVAFLLINSVGILPGLYLLISKDKSSRKK
jgi:hypothetical protein